MKIRILNAGINRRLSIVFSLLIAFSCSTFATAQQDEIERQDQRAASIKRMKQRVAEIEKEIKTAEFSRTQDLGDEAFGLMGQIDETYLNLKESYQQQVIQLNNRMQQVWQKLESEEGESRQAIDRKLELLEQDWDRVYQRLTKTHDQHLEQLKVGIAKLRNQFSEVARRAEKDLENSHFEALARWEKTHEIFLDVNQTYVKIVGDNLEYLQGRVAATSNDSELVDRMEKVKDRYFAIQQRLQRRFQSHLGHLGDEIDVRKMHLDAISNWEKRAAIQIQLDELSDRKHATFERLQDSFRETIKSLASLRTHLDHKAQTKTGEDLAEIRDQVSEFESDIKKANSALRKSYLARVASIDGELKDLEKRKSTASNDDENRLLVRIEALQKQASILREKAEAIKTDS